MASGLHLRLIFVLFLAAIPVISSASERHALVIGNSNYKAAALNTPINDATAMAAQLQAMGYTLYTNGPVLDLDRVSMERTIDEFAQSLPLGANAVFYYAGHGMATDRDNFLVPINSVLTRQSQLRDQTLGLRSIVNTLKSYNPGGVNVVLLDASRKHPLIARFPGVQSGFQPLNDVPQGVFIGYAAASNQVSAESTAGDDVGNAVSSYTRQLLDSMAAASSLDIKQLHQMVSNRVYQKTNGAQRPMSEDRVYGNWCFTPCSANKAAVVQLQAVPEKPLNNIQINPTRNYWKIAGGVVLGLVVLAIATDKDDPTPQVAVSLTPPGQ